MKDLKYLLLEEVSAITRMHERTLRKKIKSGELKAFKPGKHWLITQRDLDMFITRYRAEGMLT